MSSMPITVEKLKALITCSLCLDTFNSPRALQCLHTFCEGCLQDIVKISYSDGKPGHKCPSCRKFTLQTDLKSNFHTVQLIDLYLEATQSRKCVHCKTKQADWKCNDCVEYFCGECKDGHLSVRVLRHHKMTPATDEETKLVLNKSVHCAKHPEEMVKYNCKDCESLLCTTCALVDHEGHRYETITDALVTYISKIKKLSREISLKAEHHTQNITELQQQGRNLQNNFNLALRAAEERKLTIMAKAEKDFKTLKSTLTELTEIEKSKLENGIKEEERKAAELKTVSACVENTLLMAEDTPLMLEIRQLLPSLREAIKNKCASLEGIQIPNIKVSLSDNMNENCIGEVVHFLPNVRFPTTDFSTMFKGNTKLTKVVSIEYTHRANGYRIIFSFGMICVCFWDIAIVAIFTSEGKRLNDIVLHGKVTTPKTGIVVDASTIIIVGANGLYLIDINSSSIKRKYDSGSFCDIGLMGNTAHALCRDGTVWTIRKTFDWETADLSCMDTCVGKLPSSSTMVITTSCFYICAFYDKIFQYNLGDATLTTTNIEKAKIALCAVNTNGDLLVTCEKKHVNIVKKGKPIYQIEIPGATMILDVIFESSGSFWVYDEKSGNPGNVELKHYMWKC